MPLNSMIGCIRISVLFASIPAAIAQPAGDAREGREAFNQYCYHCHGSDGVQGERARDLRRLTKRYGDERRAVFLKTMAEGRVDKGMPSWRGVLSDERLAEVWAFLETIQAP